MSRNEFRSWAAGLSEGEFARALAALGVLLHAHSSYTASRDEAQVVNDLDALLADAWEPVAWELTLVPRALEFAGLPTAQLLASAWERSRLRSRARLEIWSDPALPARPARVGGTAISPVWIAAQLSLADVGAASVYVRADEPAGDASWRWPARVGFLEHERSRDLRVSIEHAAQQEWLRPLVTVVGATDREAVDLLLLPLDLRPALAALAAAPAPPRADCIVLFGRAPANAGRTWGLVESIRAVAVTSGVALVHARGAADQGSGAGDSQVDFFVTLIRELSHDWPIDAALFQAAEVAGVPRPFFSASRQLIEFSRAAAHLRRVAARMREPDLRMATVEVEEGSAAERALDLAAGTHGVSEVADALERAAAMPEAFIHETDGTTASVEMEAAATADARPEAAAEPRFIQTRVFDVDQAGGAIERRLSLRRRTLHEIRMRIGARDETWISPPAGAPPVPVELLPPEEVRHELRIVLADTRLVDPPQLATIFLPRNGDSSEASFFVRIGDEDQRGWRITVLHRNRVLQTALLRAAVTDGADAGTTPIEVLPEAILHSTFTDLDLRAHFHAALVLNHTPDGSPSISAIQDGEVRTFLASPDLKTVIKAIDRKLADVARDRQSFEGGLRSEASESLLRSLARNGRLLYQHIVRDGIGEADLARGERFHVVAATADARLPIEFVYDRRAPANYARLCEDAEDSLRKGVCGPRCPRGAAESTVICPLGFWGLRNIIERHQHHPDLARRLGADQFELRAQPARGRQRLEVLRGGIVGGNWRVDKAVPDGLKSVCVSMADSTGRHAGPLDTWDAWQQAVAQIEPSLLVLIVHSEGVPNETWSRLEIGRDSWVEAVDFATEYVRRDETAGVPALVLLGCETAAPQVDFQGFVAAARAAGAGIVVVAGATIHSVHAVVVARQLLAALRKLTGSSGATFGEVFRAVRRELLAQGYPMVLTLEAHGDADWLLVPTN